VGTFLRHCVYWWQFTSISDQ